NNLSGLTVFGIVTVMTDSARADAAAQPGARPRPGVPDAGRRPWWPRTVRQAGGLSGQVVFTVSSGSLAGHRSAIENSVANVRALPHVLSAGDPLSSATTARNRRTAYAVVNFGENPATLGSSYISRVGGA